MSAEERVFAPPHIHPTPTYLQPRLWFPELPRMWEVQGQAQIGSGLPGSESEPVAVSTAPSGLMNSRGGSQ